MSIHKIKTLKISSREQLKEVEKMYHADVNEVYEAIPYAQKTSYINLAEDIMDDADGSWVNPLYLTISRHASTIGISNLCQKAIEYIEILKEEKRIDIISITAMIENGYIILKTLVRPYGETYTFKGFFEYINEDKNETVEEDLSQAGVLKVPGEYKDFSYTDEEKREHDTALNKQLKALNNSTFETPFLNSINTYVPEKLYHPLEYEDLIYDLESLDKKTKTITDYEEFTRIFREVLTTINGVDYAMYVNTIRGDISKENFMEHVENIITETYINGEEKSQLHIEDVQILKDKIERALFQMYIVQDLIDDPDVTDIKITGPDDIRVRIHGKAYSTNITFIDRADYLRFVHAIALRNNIQENVPEQTFTDKGDEHYILRFSLIAEYVTSDDWPYLHIRKVSRDKLLHDDLIRLGMFDQKVWDYIKDCGRTSRGVVFAGPPGSGKTVALNCFLEEAYEQSAEILVIQENDELFAYRKGVMFQHVVNYSQDGEETVTLEDLGVLALVAGANVFIIGEAKGAEICSAITLANSGCRSAITLHSMSATDTINKMADLAMRGYAKDFDQAKRMLTAFQTIIYLKDFKVREIVEITGYDEVRKDMIYRYIYRYGIDANTEGVA